MKHSKFFSQAGVTLIEMVVTLGIVSILGLILTNISRYADRQAKMQIEDVQTMIGKLGASKVITRDLANANLSFNYINIADNLSPTLPKPFFTLAKNEYCQELPGNTCKRSFKLFIPPGLTKSDAFYIITTRGVGPELLRYPRNTKNMFNGATYNGVNNLAPDISKNNISASPWIKDRLVMLTSTDDYYDCFNKTQTMGDTAGCPISCATPGTCNYVAKRELKLLGIVNTDEKDMTYYPVAERPTLLKNKYKLCKKPDGTVCTGSTISFGSGLKTSENLFRKMPFLPGQTNGAFISPVEFVRYHLERPTANSPDHEIRFFRSVAEKKGSELSFDRAHILMTGAQSVVFTRINISNPTIEYKINRARVQQSIK